MRMTVLASVLAGPLLLAALPASASAGLAGFPYQREIAIRSNQVDDFDVNGRIIYYFGDDRDDSEDHALTVRAEAEPGAEQTADTPGSDGSSTPGFAAVVAITGLLAAYLRRRRI